MVENKSSIFGIIALIVGASGLGLGAFSFVNFQIVEGPQGPPGQDGQDGIDGIDGIQGPPGTLGILVGLWENLSRNMNYAPYTLTTFCLIEVGAAQKYNNNYIYLNNSNTRFCLNKSGWYRVNIVAMIYYSGATGVMSISVYKDGIQVHIPFRSLDFDGPVYYHFSTQFYISSNGTNHYEFVLSGSFGLDIYSYQLYNQLAIEYLGVE